jgi:hypothetical protein
LDVNVPTNDADAADDASDDAADDDADHGDADDADDENADPADGNNGDDSVKELAPTVEAFARRSNIATDGDSDSDSDDDVEPTRFKSIMDDFDPESESE